MSSYLIPPVASRTKAFGRFFALVSLIFSAVHAQAAVPGGGTSGTVDYAPYQYRAQQEAPLTQEYVLTITAPANLPVGVATSANLTVTTEVAPDGEDLIESASFVTFSAPAVTFTGPGQIQNITVRLAIPAGTADGSFKYRINTTGWPVGLNITDPAAYINATIDPPSAPSGPSVTIASPLNGATFKHAVGSPALNIPIEVRGAATSSAPVLGLIATISGPGILLEQPVALTLTALGTEAAAGVHSIPLSQPGEYTIKAIATNIVGTATTTSTFTISEIYPPTVVIHTPAEGTEYSRRINEGPVSVPFTFTANAIQGEILTLTATIDGEPVTFAPNGLGTLTATGSKNLQILEGASYQLKVVATNEHGTAEDTTWFRVNVTSPVPTIVITDPQPNEIFNHTIGTPNLNIPFEFVTTTSEGFGIEEVYAWLDDQPIEIGYTEGLNTVSATSNGTMVSVAPGTHVLKARGISSGIPVETSVTFEVREVAPLVPPSVVIDTPADGSTYTIQQGSSQTVNLTFTGTSNYSGGKITGMAATLNGTPLTVSYTTSDRYGYGTATFQVSQAGTYTIDVSATDAVGTATDQGKIHVTVIASTTQRVCGTVFFDADFNGARNTSEPPLAGITVQLQKQNGTVVATTTTNASGQYSFNSVASGSYIVVVKPITGLSPTTLNEVPITVLNATKSVPDVGFGLKFADFCKLAADGYTIGYWKNNIDKALACKTNGTQVSKAQLQSYTSVIGSLALDPFKCITLSQASAVMSNNSSNAADLLAKQLMASEYNYANGAYIGGNKTLTYCFIFWGEYVLQNKTRYDTNYLTFAKDWFDAYNNSHGGLIAGPCSSCGSSNDDDDDRCDRNYDSDRCGSRDYDWDRCRTDYRDYDYDRCRTNDRDSDRDGCYSRERDDRQKRSEHYRSKGKRC